MRRGSGKIPCQTVTKADVITSSKKIPKKKKTRCDHLESKYFKKRREKICDHPVKLVEEVQVRLPIENKTLDRKVYLGIKTTVFD